MRFYLFERQAEAHIRRSREYLEEANVRRVEHQAAAEHHNALAEMYASRLARIQAEMGPVPQQYQREPKVPAAKVAERAGIELLLCRLVAVKSRAIG